MTLRATSILQARTHTSPRSLFLTGLRQHLATYTEQERDSWVEALRRASHRTMRQRLQALRERLRARLGASPMLLAAMGSGGGGSLEAQVEAAAAAVMAASPVKKAASVIGKT